MQARALLTSVLEVLIKKILYPVFFMVSIGNFVHGQGNNFNIDKKKPSWILTFNSTGLKPATKDVSDGYFLAVYETQNHVELQEEYTHVIREIISDAGVQNGSQISVTYEPGFQKLIFHDITLWRDNKPVNKLQQSRFKVLQNEKDLSKFIYSGTFDAFLLLDDVRKGDRIEYAYTIKGNNPIFGDKFASSFYFEGSSSIGHIYTNVIINKNRSLNLKNFNFNDPPKITEQNGLKVYEWENKLTKTHRITDFEPSWYNPLRRSQLTEYANWNEVVNWGLSVNDYRHIETPLLNRKVNELQKKTGNNDTEYIEQAIRFVQDEIRYMGIEMGIYSHRPNSPEKVLRQRYGDCKDKSLLLVQLLKARNINAFMAYVNTYNTIKTKEYLPSPFAFNHVVVVIEHNNNKTWVDPTIAYQRGTFDNIYFPNYGDALVIKKGNNALEPVVSIPSGKLVSELKFEVADTIAGSRSILTIKSTYTDNYADNIRSEIAESGIDGMEKDYLEYYGKYYPDIELKESLKVLDNEKTNTLELIECYEIENIWEEDKKTTERYLALYGDLISPELRNITAKNRLAPLSLKYPVNIEQNIIVNMPYESNFGTESFKIENDAYYFELYQFQRNKTITFNYVFRNMKEYIDGSAVKNYTKDKAKIEEYLTYYIHRETTGSESGINLITLWTFIFSLIIAAVFFYKLYHKSTAYNLEMLEYARSIDGWLVFLAIRVVLQPIALIANLIRLNFLDVTLWSGAETLNAPEQYILKMIYLAEVVTFSVMISYGILLIFLFFKKRESFPKLFVIYCSCLIGFYIADNAASVYIRSVSDQPLFDGSELPGQILSLLFNVCWIWYVTKSERVKETFVYTYPEIEWKQALMKHYDTKVMPENNSADHFEQIAENKQDNSSENVKKYEDV